MGIRLNNRNAMSTPPDLVVFDLDNTLYPYDVAHRRALETVSKKAEDVFNIKPEDFTSLYESASKVVKQRLGRSVASSHSRLLYFYRLAEVMGVGSHPRIALDLEQTYWAAFLSKSRLFDGVVDLLEEFRVANIMCACVTDLTAQIQFRKLLYWRLDHYFRVVVTSEEAGEDKPAKAMFDLVIEKCPVSPEVVWMIGDNEERDIRGAKDAIDAVTFLRVDRLSKFSRRETAADVVFDDFRSLREACAGMLNQASSQSLRS